MPDSRALARASRSPGSGGGEPLPGAEEEAFQLILGRLRYFNIDRELRTLMVASAASDDGRTTIARHLAAAAARTGSVVLLVDADLRQPALAEQLYLQAGPGLSDVLIGSLSLWSATQPVALDQRASGVGDPIALDVLVAGALPRASERVGRSARDARIGRSWTAATEDRQTPASSAQRESVRPVPAGRPGRSTALPL